MYRGELTHLKEVEPPREISLGPSLHFFFSHICKTTNISIQSSWENLDIMLVLKFFLVTLPLLLGIHASVLETAGYTYTPAIVEGIKEIQGSTEEMASVVKNWDGDVLAALPITAASNAVMEAIKSGTETANKSKKMGVGKAIKVKRATKELLKVLESSLGTITSTKALFDHAGLTSIMRSRLEETKEAADALIGAIVEKLPKVGRKTGRKLGRKIAAAFDSAIADFSAEPGQDPEVPSLSRL